MAHGASGLVGPGLELGLDSGAARGPFGDCDTTVHDGHRYPLLSRPPGGRCLLGPRRGTRGLRTSDRRGLGGAGTGLAAAARGPGEGHGVSSSRGGRGGSGDGGGKGAGGAGELQPGWGPGPVRCWGGDARLASGCGARAWAAGSATERAGPRPRPHPRVGAQGEGGREAGAGDPAELGFPASGFPSAS